MRTRQVVTALMVLAVAAACVPGSPDLGYSPTGSAPIGNVTVGRVQVVARADGGVVATGSPARPLTRITAAGVVDIGWGASLPTNCRRISRAVAAGANVLVTCGRRSTATAPDTWQVWRVTAAGALDPAFGGGDGIVDLPPVVNEVDVAPLPGGGFLTLGHESVPPDNSSVPPLAASTYSASGAFVRTVEIDVDVPDLGSTGWLGWRHQLLLLPAPTGAVAVEEVHAALDDNSFEISMSRVQRFAADGNVADDLPFSEPFSGDTLVTEYHAATALADGRVVLAVHRFEAEVVQGLPQIREDSFLRMLRTDGSPDPGFGVQGTAPLRIPGQGLLVGDAITVSNSGETIVVAGHAGGGQAGALRFDATTGDLDVTFGDGGRAGLVLTTVDSLVPRAGLNLLYAGGFDPQQRPAVARIWDHEAS